MSSGMAFEGPPAVAFFFFFSGFASGTCVDCLIAASDRCGSRHRVHKAFRDDGLGCPGRKSDQSYSRFHASHMYLVMRRDEVVATGMYEQTASVLRTVFYTPVRLQQMREYLSVYATSCCSLVRLMIAARQS
jgi:hypothetical protein